jgi:plastocyanin
MLVGITLVWCLGSIAPIAYAVDSSRPIYDWEQPSYEPGYRKPSSPAGKPANPVPSTPSQERWKKPVPHPQNDLRIDKSQAVESLKPSGPINVPSTGPIIVPPKGAVTSEAASQAGPVIVGRVMYRGPVPAPIQVEVDRDIEICGQVKTMTTLSVDPATHGVRDAIVHVWLGQEMVENIPVNVAVLQNDHCAFYPRITAVLAGSETEIRNNDPVMHNTNMALNNRTVLNVALVAGGAPIRKPLKKGGLHLIKCNVHKFMQAYRYVFADPFFDQTNEAGQFRITGLPPGLHAISVWHETLGVLHSEVQVPARGMVTVDFEYK